MVLSTANTPPKKYMIVGKRGDQDNEPLWYSARPDDATGVVGVFKTS